MSKKPEVFEIADNASISVERVVEPSLADARFDPFNQHKKDTDKFHYRAINKKAMNVSKREAEGYQTIGGSEFGDLVLARLPREVYEARKARNMEKARRQVGAAREQYMDKARREGFKPFDEK